MSNFQAPFASFDGQFDHFFDFGDNQFLVDGHFDMGDSTLLLDNVQTSTGYDTAAFSGFEAYDLSQTTMPSQWAPDHRATASLTAVAPTTSMPPMQYDAPAQTQLQGQLPLPQEPPTMPESSALLTTTTTTSTSSSSSSSNPLATSSAAAGPANASGVRRGRGRPRKAAEEKSLPYYVHCHFCRDEKVYKRSEGLRQHMAVQHGVFPEGCTTVACDECGARFGRQSDLNRHKRCKGEHKMKDSLQTAFRPRSDEEVADTFAIFSECSTMSNALIAGRELLPGRSDPRVRLLPSPPTTAALASAESPSATPTPPGYGVPGPSTWANTAAAAATATPPPPPPSPPAAAPTAAIEEMELDHAWFGLFVGANGPVNQEVPTTSLSDLERLLGLEIDQYLQESGSWQPSEPHSQPQTENWGSLFNFDAYADEQESQH